MNELRPELPDRDFSLDHYREIIQTIKQSHTPLSFCDAHQLGESILEIDRFVIMRHDVEINLHSALQLAKIDASEGIHSTFFLLYTGDYNIFRADGAEIVREILELGHDIGLHYDAALLDPKIIDIDMVLTNQVELMESYFRTQVYAMSSHLPMRSGKTFSVRNVIDTYAPLYMTHMKYLSDSTQAWREGVVTNCLDRFDKIHLLTHEYIWDAQARDWDALLLISAKQKFDELWTTALKDIDRFRLGLKMRSYKDEEFKKKFLASRPDNEKDGL